MPAPCALTSLMSALDGVSDPRQPRGVRHPFSGILGLMLLGLICRKNSLAGLQRSAMAISSHRPSTPSIPA